MPIYEYHCPNCNDDFELMRRMSDVDKPASCPRCGSQAEKLISAAASKVGFYIRASVKPPFRKSTGQGEDIADEGNKE